uniref:Uncharacterized protein n=1 Tax=Periophthalmus magnuspinnatus TaxID=409849 RepID=A0A3B3ZF84_9GOBI
AVSYRDLNEEKLETCNEGSHEDGRRGDRGESLEKHYKESRRERDKHREYYTGGRVDADEMYRHVERRKEGSQDRRDDRERNRIEERLMEKERRRERDTVDMNSGEHIKKTDRRRRDREETQERERDRQRQREKDKVRDKYTDEERVRRRQEREKEVRREEGDREYKHYRDRRSHESIDKGGSEYTDKYNRERRERHRERERQGEEYGISRSEKERRERHAERKQSEHKEGKGMCAIHLFTVEYEDDFEELDESDNEDGEKEELVEHKEELSLEKREEIKAIQRAMDEENKKVGALSRQNTTEIKEERPKWSRESETTESQTPQRGKFMDFVAAKQREVNKKVASKQKKRSAELLRLIDLDFTLTSSLLDLPPVNEYEMYIRSFGTANTKQAYVQCNEDNADRDIQTEEIELTEKWTQHPPEHSGACGGENLFLYDFDFGIYILSLFSDPNISPKTRDGPLNELNIDSKRLTTFLQSASQVTFLIMLYYYCCCTPNYQISFVSLSSIQTYLFFKVPEHLRYILYLIHFSEVQKHTMISVHTSTTKPSAVLLGNHTLICIWNIWEPSRPQKILLYESEVQCCCFSPGKATLVFAGTTVGSVVLWDLREHTSNHYQMTIGDDEWTFRHPSFSTGLKVWGKACATQCIRSLFTQNYFISEATGLSFQLASLDESGILNFWVVVELPKTNVAGSPTDLGLRPGGKVKLLHSSTLSVSAHLQMLRLKFLPTDSNHFFIGTNMGTVHHGTSHGLKALPKFYRDLEGNEKPVDINSISFSPFRQDLFLVGCGDGCIRLHSVSQEKPLIEWRDGCAGQSVVSVQWSQTRPAVFSVLDSASNIYLWDLLKNETKPVITEGMGKDRVTAMALFGDSEQRNTYSGVALAHESGKIQIQYFTSNLTVSSLSEVEKLTSLIEAI